MDRLIIKYNNNRKQGEIKMIKIENGVLEISESLSTNYNSSSPNFIVDIQKGNEVIIGLDIIRFAIFTISHLEKTKTLKSLLKRLDQKIKRTEESRKRIEENKKTQPLIDEYWKKLLKNNKWDSKKSICKKKTKKGKKK